MTTYFLLIANLYVPDHTASQMLQEWFPWHYLSGSRGQLATAFHLSNTKLEVLEVLIKAQVLAGAVSQLSAEEFGALVEEVDAGCQTDTMETGEEGRAVTLHGWMRVMREGVDLLGDVSDAEEYHDCDEGSDEDSDGDEDDGDDDEDDDDDNMSIDSEEPLAARFAISTDGKHLTAFGEKVLDDVNLTICEKLDLPLGSYHGALL